MRVHSFATARSEEMEECSKMLNFSQSGEYVVVHLSNFQTKAQADTNATGVKSKAEVLGAIPLGAVEQMRNASNPVFLSHCFAAHASL